VQAARLGVRPLVLDASGRAGGLLENARLVENYPGLEGPVSGLVFAARLAEHLARFGLTVESGRVDSLEPFTGGRARPSFLLRGAFGLVAARSVIVAVGTTARPLNVPGERALAGARLFYEVKHLLPHPPPRVLVIGGGEAALDYSLSLVAAGARVEMCIRAERPAARGRLLEQALAQRHLSVRTKTEPLSMDARGAGVAVTVQTPQGRHTLTADAVLVAVGRVSAATALLGRAEPRGLFVIGDARRGKLGQAGMAVGDGLHAAASAVDYLSGAARC
jgi:thioredoxin reductase